MGSQKPSDSHSLEITQSPTPASSAEHQTSDIPIDLPGPYFLPSIWKYCLKPILYLVFLGVFLAILLCLATIFCLAIVPLLVIALIVIRLFQFLRYGNEYHYAALLKRCIRFILIEFMLFLLIDFGVLWGIAKVTRLKHAIFIGLSITDWVHVYCVIFGIFLLGCCIHSNAYLLIPLVPLSCKESGVNVAEGVSEIIDCLFFWWAESQVMRRVPAFKYHKILGLYTHKWIEVSFFTLITYNIITLSTHMLVECLRKWITKDSGGDSVFSSMQAKLTNRKYVIYVAYGIKHSVNFIFSSLLLLLVWVLHIGSYLKETTPLAKNVFEFGTWAFISILICSLLWLMKTCVILSWEARSTYSRLESKIILGGKQLYFLGIIGRDNYNIFGMGKDTACESGANEAPPSTIRDFSSIYGRSADIYSSWNNDGRNLSMKRSKEVRNELMMDQNPTMYNVQEVAQYILMAKDDLTKEKYTTDILENLKSGSRKENQGCEEYLKRLINIEVEENKNNQRSYFEDQLPKHADSSTDVSFESKLEDCMERARHKCVCLANTLSSAQEIVDCLNKIISWILIGATIIIWLLLTGLATTKVLVLIASPLLAVTFIFGDTCKTMFQGVMFAYVVHSFDVGDLCLIDEDLVSYSSTNPIDFNCLNSSNYLACFCFLFVRWKSKHLAFGKQPSLKFARKRK